ncbi:MAG TPA: GNAT family N-acetyltransferase [Acidobacteriaceae bacterium]|nr:GNAT family N-acetyltransferase [Acidobacteriaceae bacterium]
MMTFRFAEDPDQEALMGLINRAFAVESFFIRGDRVSPQRLREYMQTGRFLLAEENGALLGCVYVELHGEAAYLGLLSVDPARQKAGLGRRMVGAAEEFARETGARRMELTVVNLRTELPPFYQKLGYALAGTEPIREEMLPRVNQACHFIRMSKPLGGRPS